MIETIELKTPGVKEIKYDLLLQETELIIREIEDPKIDLDGLVMKVERGYQLIKEMQSRIAVTRTKIEELTDAFSVVVDDKDTTDDAAKS